MDELKRLIRELMYWVEYAEPSMYKQAKKTLKKYKDTPEPEHSYPDW